MSTPPSHDSALHQVGFEIRRIGSSAVRNAQEESRRRGVPNVYFINGVLYYEDADGRLVTTDPYRDHR